ncbi:MAG: Ig-like domain-containing protein [Gemmatimonadales bacterium]
MPGIRSARALSVFVILATAGACGSESLGPATSGAGTMTVVPSVSTIGEGQALQLTATLVDEFGDPLEATIDWSSSNPDVATVSVGGTVFGRREGRAAIVASAHGRARTAAVVVLRGEASEGKPRPPSTN